jgi:hypothetical protein
MTDQTLEQEKELQKNLVKDVFFSPSIQETASVLSSSCSSSQSGGDDNYSLMSDSYQDDDMLASVIDSAESSFSCTHQPCDETEQFVFPYSLDLYPSVVKVLGDRRKSNSIITTTTTTTTTTNHHRLKKTVKKPILSNKTKKPRKKTILQKKAADAFPR